MREGKAGEAEYYLESAFKYVPDSVRGIILAGKVAASRGNHAGAIAIWTGLEQCAPEALGEVVNLVSASFAETGDHQGYRKFLVQAFEKNPDAIYLILGATHPDVIKSAGGDEYRHVLKMMVDRLGIEDHVLFHNRFVTIDVLCRYLSAADVYCTPYPSSPMRPHG